MNILLLSILALSSSIFLSFLSTEEEVYAQTEEVNQNSLVACVDYYSNLVKETKESLTESQLQQPAYSENNFFDENNSKIISTVVCDLGYEHTGKYSHLLSIELQRKYMEMAALQIYIGKIPLN